MGDDLAWDTGQNFEIYAVVKNDDATDAEMVQFDAEYCSDMSVW